MEGLTDAAFRFIVAKYGKPDVSFTEFTSSDGLCSVAKDKLFENLIFDKTERPIVAQLFGTNPDKFYDAVRIIEKLKFDGIDINMGCPDKNIVKKGAGAALIKTPDLACKIILATKKATNLPVSIKTRIGYDKIVTEEWITYLLSTKPAAITVHGRIKTEMYKGKAHWDEIAKVVLVRDKMKSKTLIIGNGDIQSLDQAYRKMEETKVDGIMVGRAILGNPWFFNKKVKKENLKRKEILDVMVEHAYLFEKLFTNKKNFASLKKHFAAYISGFENSKRLKIELMNCTNADEVRKVVNRQVSIL